MTYEDFAAAAQRGAQMLDNGDREGAMAVFRELSEGDLPDMDRSAMCVNVAVIHHQLGDVQSAIDWYDKGIKLEARHGRFAISELKAGYLVQIGRTQESLAHFQRLLKRSDLNLGDRTRMTKIIRELGDIR